jgi:hypothetical protein
MWCPVEVAVAATVDTDTSGAVNVMAVRRPADGIRRGNRMDVFYFIFPLII